MIFLQTWTRGTSYLKSIVRSYKLQITFIKKKSTHVFAAYAYAPTALAVMHDFIKK